MSTRSMEILDPGILGALLDLIGPEAALGTLGELVDAWGQSSLAHVEALTGSSSPAEIRRRVHSLKGATAQLGGNALVALCVSIESAIDGGAPIEVEALRGELSGQRQVLLEALISHFGLS